MTSPTAINQLSYKELQAALKELREQGLTSIKLNSKRRVLQEELARIESELKERASDRITNATVKDEAPVPVTNSATASNELAPTNDFKPLTYPFCGNTVKVENKPTVERSETTVNEQPVFSTKVLRAMDSKYAPSWLCRPYVVYVIDGVDYLQGELEAQLQGQVCQLPAVVNEMKLQANLPPRLQQPARKDRVSKAREPQPIVNPAQDLPKVKVTFKVQEEYSPYFIDTAKAAKYSKSLGDVEKQAARNLEDGIKYAASTTKRVVGAVIDFGKGFHARQVERASKAA